MQVNAYWLLLIPFSLIVGFILCYCYILYTLKKTMGIKSWKEFRTQVKKAQAMQKKMEKGDLNNLMNDPEFRKQMEEIRKKFHGT